MSGNFKILLVLPLLTLLSFLASDLAAAYDALQGADALAKGSRAVADGVQALVDQPPHHADHHRGAEGAQHSPGPEWQ